MVEAGGTTKNSCLTRLNGIEVPNVREVSDGMNDVIQCAASPTTTLARVSSTRLVCPDGSPSAATLPSANRSTDWNTRWPTGRLSRHNALYGLV